MRYAVITDVHSNIFALKAALSEIDKSHPDKIICLGDIVGNGFFPEETVSLIRQRGDISCVKGNHDIFVNLDLKYYSGEDPRIKMFKFTRRVLSTASRNYLASLPKSLVFTDGKYSVTAFHYPTNKRGRFKDMKYLPADSEIEELFEGLKGDVFLFGHEHTGSFTELNGKYYLNFGTLGNLLEKDTARFGIVDINGDEISYTLGRARYDDSIVRETTEKLNAILRNSPNEKNYTDKRENYIDKKLKK